MAPGSPAMSPQSPPKIKAAVVHASPVYMDKQATTAKVLRLIEEAGEKDVQLLAFPETFVPGYPYFIQAYPPLQTVDAVAQYAQQSVVCDESDATVTAVRDACREAGVAVVLGVSERAPDGGHTLFNSQLLIDTDGRLVGVHRKLQPTHAERIVWAAGGGWTLRVWSMGGDGGGGGDGGDGGDTALVHRGYRLGALVCWEHTMNGARQALIEQGQQIHVGAWPGLAALRGWAPVADAQVEALMKTTALAGQIFVLCAASPVDDACLQWMQRTLGPQDHIGLGGGWSALIHPFCNFLAGPHASLDETMLIADLDLADLGPVKVWLDTRGHYKRPEIFSFSVEKRPLWPHEGPSGASPAAPMDGFSQGR